MAPTRPTEPPAARRTGPSRPARPDALMEMGGLTAEQTAHITEQAEAKAEEASSHAQVLLQMLQS